MFERPGHIKRLVDYMIGGCPTKPGSMRTRSASSDFRAAAIPDWSSSAVFQICTTRPGCAWMSPRLPFSGQLRDPERPAYTPVHDPRIKAAVIADPGFRMRFGPDSLKTVTVPVQLWASERGGDGVLSKFIEDVKGLLPSPPDYHVVYDAGHFAFLAPWTPGQMAAAPDLCIDSNELRARRLQSVQCGGQRVLSAAP
jgi:predicted dienelactone hydrolase